MKVSMSILTAIFLSLSANATVVDGQTFVSCGTFTLAQGGGFENVIHKASIKEIEFRNKVEVEEETATGPVTYIFGVGKVNIRQNIEMMDADGQIIHMPIELTAEVVHSTSEPKIKRLIWTGKIFNVFTGLFESVNEDRTVPVSEKFFHMRHEMPANRLVQHGKPRASGLICHLLAKTEIGHQLP